MMGCCRWSEGRFKARVEWVCGMRYRWELPNENNGRGGRVGWSRAAGALSVRARGKLRIRSRVIGRVYGSANIKHERLIITMVRAESIPAAI